MPDIVIVKGEIGNALHSIAPDHITGVADDIFDEGMQMYQSEINSSSLVYDISANHLVNGNPSTYDDLADALGVDGANVPEKVRRGGMSVKFVHTSDNKYVQYRLMTDSFSTIESNWQGVDDTPIPESDNLVKSGGVEKELRIFNMTGNGDIVVSSSNLNVKQGNTYRIYINKPDISLDGISYTTSDFLRFVIRPFNSAGERVGNVDLVNIGMDTSQSPLSNYYDFTIPDGVSYIGIKMRAAAGTKQTFWIEDITVTTTLPSSNDMDYADFSISDESGNNILVLSNGNLLTKNFDSSKSASVTESGLMSSLDKVKLNGIEEGAEVNNVNTENINNIDFSISDESGNDILILHEGGIKTKNFDSSKITQKIMYTGGLFVFDLEDVECSPLGSVNVAAKGSVTEPASSDVSILRHAYGCIYLPETYTPNGTPTRLILFATGGHTYLDKIHGWMPSAETPNPWLEVVIKDLTDRGYAVFGASIPGVTYQEWLNNAKYGVPMGLPDIMESSYRAYQYIIANYNVYKEIYIWGCSEGGLLALNWGIIHRDIVAAIAHCGGCVSVYSEWVSYGNWNTLRKRVATILGFADTTGDDIASYEHDKADVFDPYTRLFDDNGTKKIHGWNVPIKFFFGTADDILTTDSIIGDKSNYNVNFHNAIVNSGGISFFKWYKDYNHSDVAMGRQENVRKDVINWFNHN